MSRVGKLPINIPAGVKVAIDGKMVSVSSGSGSLQADVGVLVKVTQKKIEGQDNEVVVVSPVDSTDKKCRAMWGTTRSLINNMIIGLDKGFTTDLEVNGVGYRASVQGDILTLYVGYSHEIKYLIPKDVKIECPKPTLIKVSGTDKDLVGRVCALIIRQRPKSKDPYKGKGIGIVGQRHIMKEGKKK